MTLTVATWNQATDLALHHVLVRQPRFNEIVSRHPGYRHFGLYPEARILGGLTPNDVEAILLPRAAAWDGVARQAEALTAGTGIEVRRVAVEPVRQPTP